MFNRLKISWTVISSQKVKWKYISIVIESGLFKFSSLYVNKMNINCLEEQTNYKLNIQYVGRGHLSTGLFILNITGFYYWYQFITIEIRGYKIMRYVNNLTVEIFNQIQLTCLFIWIKGTIQHVSLSWRFVRRKRSILKWDFTRHFFWNGNASI